MLSSQMLRGSFQSLGKCLSQRGCKRFCQQPTTFVTLRPNARHAAVAALEAAPAPEAPAAQEAQEAPVYKAYVDFKFVRDNADLIAKNCVDRGAAVNPHTVVQLYEEFVRLQQETDRLRNARNENSSAMKARKGLKKDCLPAGGTPKCPVLLTRLAALGYDMLRVLKS